MTSQAALGLVVATAADMRELGARIGARCAGGDVIVLTGDLGAGKTTLTQGIARGLGIGEQVTSPTFVIARTHQNPGHSPDLVHVDAYRLGSHVEMDELDLESDLDGSVVVVEWGAGLADDLSESRLDVVIGRSPDEHDEARQVVLTPHGDRWAAVIDDLVAPGDVDEAGAPHLQGRAT
jgi:tRNA threonylcarbamoyladenosine biosynthesis protein TsaE